MFRKVLVANRGAIACRIIRTLDRMGIASVAVYSEADRHSRHVRLAGEGVLIGPPPAAQSYLDTGAVLSAARRTGVEAIHPGYGFLSENPDFAEACEKAGIVFIGPTPAHMRAFGLKHTARELALEAGVPLAPGSGLLRDPAHASVEARRIGYPVMLKSTAGGGGIGLQLIQSEDQLAPMFARVQRLATNNFKDAGLFLEKYVAHGRHIEVQIFGDGKGRVIALGERDCSAQRRNQKVVEETPAPRLPDATRPALCDTAVRLGEAVRYANAGTIEFLYDTEVGAFYFLEVNTRLQVEHGVTEEVCGVDLVEWMVRQAAGESPSPLWELSQRGASIQVRLYAEDPARDFRPSSGLLTHVKWPEGARVETWVESGTEVSPFYDPMLAKIIVTGEDRASALAHMQAALAGTEVAGIETNLRYLRAFIGSPAVAEGRVTTRTLETFSWRPRGIEVISPGTFSSIQDYPGRTGYWNVGVPPSGPMDSLSLRLANRAVGNPEGAAALEMTLSGPTLEFDSDAVICLIGADMSPKLDGAACPMHQAVAVTAGQTLALGAILGAGLRTILAVRGGFDVPDYLGSKSTFALGKFGGHGGRTLRAGDVLHVGAADGLPAPLTSPPSNGILPKLTRTWEIGVLYGPHGAPDFFTEADIAAFFAAGWEVHYNSSRTGVRLIGPKPTWARPDGGEAGLHPSNIHDNAYAIGAVDYTGDMPVILGPDGPSLGGFVCPATIVDAELWKVGQLRPGDKLRFRRLTPEVARDLEARQEAEIAGQGPLSDDGARRADPLPREEPSPMHGANSSPPRDERPVLSRGAISPPLWGRIEPAPDLIRGGGEPQALGAGTPLASAHLPREGDLAYSEPGPDDCIVGTIEADGQRSRVVYRRAGDKYLLVEYGPIVLDLELRFRVHALMSALEVERPDGVIDLTPGIRSLQVHYDSRVLALGDLLARLHGIETQLGCIDTMTVPTRIVRLPLSWGDPSVQQVIDKYSQSVRADAPWCPSNIEFIRRINGLDSVEDVKRIVYEASYLVLGLGDVYLGAPVATPIDPRHRLVTTKYNPARTWTLENMVGIGGAYMCIYGMEGPGGYQLVGRTCQMWNTYRSTAAFEEKKPWLLRFFDQVRFYPVSAEELTRFRDGFLDGRAMIDTTETTFSLSEYRAFLTANEGEIRAFKARQQAAFDAERGRWETADQAASGMEVVEAADTSSDDLPPGGLPVASPVPGSVWKIAVAPGMRVKAGEPLLVVESMKMEIEVVAPVAGHVVEIRCAEGRPVALGQTVVVIAVGKGEVF